MRRHSMGWNSPRVSTPDSEPESAGPGACAPRLHCVLDMQQAMCLVRTSEKHALDACDRAAEESLDAPHRR